MSRYLYGDLFAAMAPEVILVVTAFIVLTLDLVSLRTGERAARTRILGRVTVLGLFASMLPLVRQWGGDLSVFNGSLVINDLAVLFEGIIAVLAIVTVVISMDYDVGPHVGEYFAVVLFGAVGMMLLVATEDLIVIFVSLELLSISLYILTAFHKGELKSQEAAVKYFMFGAMASAFLLFGLSYLYGLTGETNLRLVQAALAGPHSDAAASPLLGIAILFVLVGFGFKIAMVPFHSWAPDAYEGAPTPVAAYIATGSKVASFVILAKVVLVGFAGREGAAFWGRFAPGWTMILAVTGTLSMVWGNCAAIVQSNVKRLLAYSSIAHSGYILIGLVAATVTGAAAVLFYIIVYSLTNLGAFGVVSVLSSRVGGEQMGDFRGMARRAPLLSLLMMVFVLSLAGIPPLGGFFGKFYLFAAAIQKDVHSFGLLWLVVVGILMSAVSLYYYLVLLKQFYVVDSTESGRIATPRYVNAVLVLLALAVIGMGLFPQPILALLQGLVVRL